MMLFSQHKEPIARFLRAAPVLGAVAHRLIRLVQARFTVGAVGVILNDAGQLLLLKHVYHPRIGWGLPGGYVARHEDPATAVEREIREETGLQVRVLAPLQIGLGVNRDHLDLAYLCRLVGENVIVLNGEILDYQWVLPTALPELLSFHERAIRQALALQEGTPWASAD